MKNVNSGMESPFHSIPSRYAPTVLNNPKRALVAPIDCNTQEILLRKENKDAKTLGGLDQNSSQKTN